MVDFKLDSLANLPSVLDQWHFFLGLMIVVINSPHSRMNDYYLAWIIIVGILALIALIILLAGIFGMEAPKDKKFWYYIIGALLLIIIMGLSYGAYRGDLNFCLTFTMFIFYLYAAWLAKKG